MLSVTNSSSATAKIIASVCGSAGLSPCVRPSRRSACEDPGTAIDRAAVPCRNSVERARTESASDRMASGVTLTATGVFGQIYAAGYASTRACLNALTGDFEEIDGVSRFVEADGDQEVLALRLLGARLDVRLRGHVAADLVGELRRDLLGLDRQGAEFIQKPFTPAALAQKVREVLSRGRASKVKG